MYRDTRWFENILSKKSFKYLYVFSYTYQSVIFKYLSFCESNTEIYFLLIPEIDIEIR